MNNHSFQPAYLILLQSNQLQENRVRGQYTYYRHLLMEEREDQDETGGG